MAEPHFLTVGEGEAARRIAYQMLQPRDGRPSLFWLAGFMSDMASTKATALRSHARAQGLGYTGFDYSGHGVSGGHFTDGTISRWMGEADAVFAQVTTGPQIIVGSSMGGHIALVLIRHLMRTAPEHARRIAGLILIAPAWDMTEELMWKKFSADVKAEIEQTGFHLRPSAYAQPYTITRALIEDGRTHLIGEAPFACPCPVIVLQGLLDPDVPAAHTRRLMELLQGPRVDLIEIADGEHRLSRPQDLEKLYAAVDALSV